MARRSSSPRSVALAFISATTLGSLALASDAMRPRLYELTTETGMPHLEENLRYSITHERRCLARPDFATVFPVLAHPSLKGCRLEESAHSSDALSYVLACDGGNGTTGDAVWDIGERQSIGTLHVKLGGKNMTFYQRVKAVAVGDCARDK